MEDAAQPRPLPKREGMDEENGSPLKKTYSTSSAVMRVWGWRTTAKRWRGQGDNSDKGQDHHRTHTRSKHAAVPLQVQGIAMAKQPSATHTQDGTPKIRHRKASGQFKQPPPKQSSPSIGRKPLASAELDQDARGGYNPNHTDPQT